MKGWWSFGMRPASGSPGLHPAHWAALIRNPQVWLHRYTEKLDPVLVCKCYLWLYWKE